MATPHLETWAHAERDRQRALEDRHKAAQMAALEQYRYQVQAMSGPSLTASTGTGVLGGGSVGTWISDGTYYPSPPPSSIIAVDAEGYAALKAELEEAKRTIAEQSEIIEALAVDGDELDSLRAENEKLRAELFEKAPYKDAEGWIINVSDSSERPKSVPADAIIDIRWADGSHSFGQPASPWAWGKPYPVSAKLIAAYRIVG